MDIPLIAVTYFAWRKYKTTEFRRLFVLSVAMLLLGIWVYLVDRVFHFPPVITMVSNIVSLVIVVLIFTLMLKVGFFPPKTESNKSVPEKEL